MSIFIIIFAVTILYIYYNKNFLKNQFKNCNSTFKKSIAYFPRVLFLIQLFLLVNKRGL